MTRPILLVAFCVSVVHYSGCMAADHRASKTQVEDYSHAIQFFKENTPVIRNVSYVEQNEGAKVRLSCIPPEEKNGPEAYKELTIYQMDKEKEPAPICSVGKGGSEGDCRFDEKYRSLNMTVTKTAHYKCNYAEKQESGATAAEVFVYFKSNGNIAAYDADDKPMPMIDKVTNGTSPRFVCPGNANGTKVNWYRNEQLMKSDKNYDINATNYNLTFKSDSPKPLDGSRFGGWYMCERADQEGKNVVARDFFKLKSPAYATPVEKSYNRMEDDEVTMVCQIDGEPIPLVHWEQRKEDGSVLSLEKMGDRVTFLGYNGVRNAAVTIKGLKPDDYAKYACIAENKDGDIEHTATAEILLRVRSKLAALWPFLGIVAEVVILVAIIFIYEKRRTKKEQEDNDENGDQKKSLTASNNENKDIRQRKA